MSRSLGFRNYPYAAFALCLFSLGCAEDEYGLGDPINMGPWTFEIERVTERTENRGADRYKFILVTVRLDNYTERHRKTFDDFMNGTVEGSVWADPRTALLDGDGNRFDGSISPTSGGRMRSERWQARFLLVPSNAGLMEDASDLAKEHLDKHPGDFRLVIENPDHRRGQPRRASVRLE